MITHTNKNIYKYLEDIGCEEVLFFEIIFLAGIKLYVDRTYSTEYPFNNLDPTLDFIYFEQLRYIAPGYAYHIYEHYVIQISSLDELTALINKYKKLKAFI